MLDRLCREFCRRSPAGSHPRFDAELLSEEVKLMVHARLPHFDPERGHFGPWFKVYVLLPVYKRLCSEIDADWGRRAPQTQGGRVRRWLKRWVHAPLSLDAPVGDARQDGELPALGETVASGGGGPETQLLEDQCRERFLRALERLAEAERVLIERVHLRGERQQEVARSVGLTPGRVSQKLKRAAGRLAETLEESFEDECGGTAFCRGLSDGGGQAATGSRAAPGTVAQAAFERVFPEMVRRSGWRGTEFAQPESAGGPEGELLNELLAGPAQAGSWSTGSPRAASLATGAVAAAWALFVLAPSEFQPVFHPPDGRGPQPTTGDSRRPASSRAGSPAEHPNSAASGGSLRTVAPAFPVRPPEQTNRHNPIAVKGPQAGRSVPRVEDNGSPSVPKASPGGLAKVPKAVANPDRAGTARVQQPPATDTGSLPDEVRNPSGSRALPSGAQSVCSALAASAPVPSGLEGFAVIEVTLGVDGTLVEGSHSPQILVSGGEQVDAFVLRSLQTLAAGGSEARTAAEREAIIAGSGRYRVALEAELNRWSCQEAKQDPAENVPASGMDAGAGAGAVHKYE
ncbi:sigma-70 family RNA polymerase sigma factor [Gloeobacter violaceus]|uniref:sigma-70 family RNA polymerase sigma factor n=1 Tax=Gloeobacter violaceus TaxID=33072 RepID=UPI0013E89AF9|nr:sigma-70 family RNA polymerase sigma factor [Gloeobacter violaceus]